MRNLFIGLMDVLRGNLAKPNESITKGVPEKFVKINFVPKAFGDVGRATLKSNNITATFIGGRRFGIGLYMETIKELFSNINNDDLIVFNVLIHDNKRNRVQSREFKGNMKKAEQFYLAKISEFVNWLQAQKPNAKVVWSTSTSYKEHKVPSEFRRYQRNTRILDINRKARDIWSDAGFPVLDVFHVTLACQAKSCTEDGSHHNRMVNRAKAHVLLNNFCRPSSDNVLVLNDWRRFNALFEWLPLAAVIEDKVCCMHGGIGPSIETIEQIDQLERPCSMESGGLELMDLLWSDPTENDSVEGLRPNARGPGLVTFGPDRVKQFCENNGLQMIVRAHECVMDGFERFAQGQLLTLFSATNYCGTANNADAILVLGRDLTLYPKLIHPLPPEAMDSASPGEFDHALWMQEINHERPPTPPRKNSFFGN
ncbi:unnamed protein product [Bathycoccus prasinos]